MPVATDAVAERAAAAAASSASPTSRLLDDPRALAILSTEHWSLLSARSLVYNEAFSRAGMFLSFLSATLVALGLVATATGFSDAFLIIAAVVLGVDLFVGVATLGRIAAASSEDIRYLQAMNRVRNAYSKIAPGVEAYFVTGHYDDAGTVLGIYGPSKPTGLQMVVHGFTTTPGMIAVICSVVCGAFAAVIALLVTHAVAATAAVGLIAALVAMALNIADSQRSISGFWRSMTVRFPPPGNQP